LRNTPARHLNSLQIDQLELLDLVKPLGVDVAYDIGANSGAWTLLVKAIMPGCHVEAFEPLDCFSGWSIPGTRFHPVALGNANGKATIRATNFADASSILPLSDVSRRQFGIEEVGPVSVDLARLDDYRRERDLPFPDLIKLDVQGYELEVLKGGLDCLASAKAVISEVAFVELYEGQAEFHEIVGFMAAQGLYLHAFGASSPPGTGLLYSDVLFVRKGE
jgi:FkbM family methyltransferase